MKYSDVCKVFESLKCSVWNLVVVEAVKDFSKAAPDSKKFEDACKIVDRLWVTNVSAEDVVVMASGVCYMIDNDILRFEDLDKIDLNKLFELAEKYNNRRLKEMF